MLLTTPLKVIVTLFLLTINCGNVVGFEIKKL